MKIDISKMSGPDSVDRPAGRLTAREEEVLALAVQGLNRSQIAKRLGLRLHTVGSHMKNMYRKLGVHNRAGAVAHFFRRRLEPSPPASADLVFCPGCGCHLGKYAALPAAAGGTALNRELHRRVSNWQKQPA